MSGQETDDECLMVLAEGLTALSMLERLVLPGSFVCIHICTSLFDQVGA
jgi:hypothetical protein